MTATPSGSGPRQNASLYAARAWRVLRTFRPDLLLLAATVARSLRRDTPQAIPPGFQPRNILFVRLDAMGDLILSTPVLRELKLRYPAANITAVVQGRNRSLLENNPHIHTLLSPAQGSGSRWFAGTRQSWRLVQLYRKHLRQTSFDLAVQPRLGIDYFGSTLLLQLVHAPVTVRFVEEPQGGLTGLLERLASRSMFRVPRPPPEPEVLTARRFAEAVTGVPATSNPEVFVTEEDRVFADLFFAGYDTALPVIALSMGAQARRRMWPLENWAAVLQSLAAERPIQVLIACTRAEQPEAEALAARLTVPSRILAGAHLRQLAACFARCRLVLGPDSGLAHLAASQGCAPVVVSPHPRSGDPAYENSPLRFTPWHSRAVVLQPDDPLPPCTRGCEAVAPHCILQVTPEMVVQAAQAVLHDS